MNCFSICCKIWNYLNESWSSNQISGCYFSETHCANINSNISTHMSLFVCVCLCMFVHVSVSLSEYLWIRISLCLRYLFGSSQKSKCDTRSALYEVDSNKKKPLEGTEGLLIYVSIPLQSRLSRRTVNTTFTPFRRVGKCSLCLN